MAREGEVQAEGEPGRSDGEGGVSSAMVKGKLEVQDLNEEPWKDARFKWKIVDASP